MIFEFATAGRILFGRGSARQVPALARDLGRYAVVVLGGSDRGREALTQGLDAVGVRSLVVNIGGEPTTTLVDEAARIARSEHCDLVIAVGGGSVIDAGKAIAGLLTNPGDVLDYLEVVGGGKPLREPAVPFLAVPTTAGTGTEATRNAVLDVPEHGVKVSLRSPHLLPRVAVVDPELTLTLPPEVTAFTGMDALTQLIESFVSNAANPFTDGVCREGLARAARSLALAYRDGSDLAAREDMALAALFSGVALANARLGAVHGFAGVLGGATGRPHGALCARLLPFVMEANIRAVGERGDPATLERYVEIARTLTGDASATLRDGVTRVHELCAELKIPPLREAGLSVADCYRLIPLAQRASSMKGNPVSLLDSELRQILEEAIDR
ncbi:Alcohol dehydrogenase, class IV [Singulisphaera sp. GP187]|uniref:iron-containing alcohol dehydrogenase n=1 Tax=Singulisphaera sp. GP187 TaxID=1882752 RepID=UPI00092BD5B1|nr:iron-containing alcohol dehydrogenase [Singulisphaera sp. GP187]SIO65249.1 Alcohol dehydrogenase, class IV [Singulisphaera sp. GP187]